MTKYSLFENDVQLISSSPAVREDEPRTRYSGTLSEDMDINGIFGSLSSDYVTYVAVATRDLPLTVTLSYTSSPDAVYPVTKGHPLLVHSLVGDTLNTVSIARDDSARVTDVEIDVFTGMAEVAAEDPAFLILNAGLGVTSDDFLTEGEVSNWVDVRPVTLAPDTFDISTGQVSVIESDPDFNGEPSMDFTQSSTTTGMTYSGGDATLWDFLNNTNDYTFAVAGTFPDNGVVDGIASAYRGAGTRGVGWGIEGGYRPTSHIGGAYDGVATDELIEKPTILIYRLSGSTLYVYFQGRWESLGTVGPPSPGTSSALVVGGAYIPTGTAFRPFTGKIAELRLYNRALSSEECDALIALYVQRYAIDDTEEQGFPDVAGAYNLHRSNRGATLDNQIPYASVATWDDTRYDAASSGVEQLTGSFFYSDDGDTSFPGHTVFRTDEESVFNTATFSNNTSGGWDHLSGVTNGFTMGMVYYTRENPNADNKYLVGTTSYGGGTGGTNIFQPASLTYPDNELVFETETAAFADVVSEGGINRIPLRAYAFLFTVAPSGWRIIEIDLVDELTTEQGGSNSTAPTAQTLDDLALFGPESGGTAPDNYTFGGIAEFFTVDDQWDTDTLEKWAAYVKRRYGQLA